MLPVVALVGRPNVGKSTLFNRLTRTRDALVADFPGLTRDRKYGQANYDGYQFIVVDTGGIHDTVSNLVVEKDTGNGFLFETFDAQGLFWAISEAMAFFGRPSAVKKRQIRRIMQESLAAFNHDVTARHYIELYEKMLKRPLIQ